MASDRSRDPEPAPEADELEQAEEVVPVERRDGGRARGEVNDADAWEQAQEVPQEDDER